MIIIFSYNRKIPLLNTLNELQGVDRLIVIDDGSDYPETMIKGCEYYRTPHRGLRGFWRQWDLAFRICKQSTHKKFIFIPDDWKNLDTDRIYSTFDKLGDRFACNVTNVGWQKSWTPIQKQPSNVKGYFSVGWIDHGMITTRKVLEKLEWKMNPVSDWHFENRESSGVGKQISQRLYELGVPMYTPYKSMAQHQGCESVMHPSRDHELKPQ